MSSQRLMAALAYGLSSMGIMAVNKIVLTVYGFPSPSVVALCQMILTILMLMVAKRLGYVSFPDISIDVVSKVFPLPLLYLGNLLTGLGGTKLVNLPMFTLLRRFSILMTMILEAWLLKSTSSLIVKFSVFMMIGGALVAATNDLAFDFVGYMLIFANDLLTALNGVYLKRKLDSKELGNFGLMFYNCLVSLPITLALVSFDTDGLNRLQEFEYWWDWKFQLAFFASCIMGFVLTYAIFWCTHVNSALTTTVVGCLKNVLIAYYGMTLPDYAFSWPNFAGVNISILGSFVYSYAKYTEKTKPNPAQIAEEAAKNHSHSHTSGSESK